MFHTSPRFTGLMTFIFKVLLLGVVAADELLPLQGGVNRGCKAVKSTPVEKWTAKDVQECKAICTGQCQAVQYSNHSHVCALYKAPVLHTVALEGEFCYARTVTEEAMATVAPKETLCLRSEASCAAMGNRHGCLMSKDSGGPCVWCGGAACSEDGQALCTAFAAWRRGGAVAHGADAEVASCSEGKAQVAEAWQAPAVGAEVLQLLSVAKEGCKSLTDKEQCLNSKDGSVATLKGFKVNGEACVWCGGITCTSEDSSTCGAFDYVMHGEGTAFDLFHAKHSYEVAGRSTSVKHASWNGACLEKVAAGCPSLTDEYSCLASVEYREEDPYHPGVKVKGEPCAWCNGAVCHSNGTNRCEVYNIQMHGAGTAYHHALTAGITVAQCEGGLVKRHLPTFQVDTPPFPIQRPTAAETACLKAAPDGCSALKSKLQCLSSVDGSVDSFAGLRIKGEPCVWCGGGHCHTGSDSLCAPFDYLAKGTGRAFGTLNAVALTTAKCSLSTPDLGELACLKEVISGCNTISNRETCVSSVDARPYAQVAGYKVQGQPCVWCGGLPCRSGGSNKCEPFDYAVNLGRIFHRETAPLERAGCNGSMAVGLPALKPLATSEVHADWLPETDSSCLKPVTRCRDVRDKLICLSAKDSEMGLMKSQLGKGGDACVWCGGQACTSAGDSLCESYAYLHRGEGLAFDKVTTTSHVVAQCLHNGVHAEVDCLAERKDGCNSIRDAKQCLSSMDTRPYERVAGLRVKGQPCVWCGGQACTSNNDNLCEPLDFVLNGAGHAFSATQVAGSSRSMAGCKAGHPVSLPLPAATNLGEKQEQASLHGAGSPTGATGETGGIKIGGDMVANLGKDCWEPCGKKSGYCDFCGAGNACCRHDEQAPPGECEGNLAFQTWHHECVAPRGPVATPLVKASAATAATAAAAAAAVTEAPTAPIPMKPLMNIGKDCWWECGEKSGACPFCGAGNACCRRDEEDTVKECQGSLTFTTWHHECVVPVHSESTALLQKVASAGVEAASQAAQQGLPVKEQVRQAALAIGKAAKKDGLSAQSAGQIAAEGALEAAKKNGASVPEQQELAIMAAALAATEAVADAMPPVQKASEIGLAVAEAAAVAGMGKKEQMEAAAVAVGTYAADSGIPPAQAAEIAAAGARRATKAAGKDEKEQGENAAKAAAIAAAGAAKGKSGQELATIISTAVLAAVPEMSPEEKLKAVRDALKHHAAQIGMTPEQLEALAKQSVPAAATAAVAPPAKAGAHPPPPSTESPYEAATQAGKEAFEAAKDKPLAEQIAAAEAAAKAAALKAGAPAAQAAALAAAVGNAVGGGAPPGPQLRTAVKEPGEAAAAVPAVAAQVAETPAMKDAAQAGAEAARLAKAAGKTPEEQVAAAAEAAGRAAMNGHMDDVGAVEAARRAATLAGIEAGLSAQEAARLGTAAAEKAEVSGAFTAQNWRAAELTTTSTTTTMEENATVIMARAGANAAAMVAELGNLTAVSDNETIVVTGDDGYIGGIGHVSKTLQWVLVGSVLACLALACLACCCCFRDCFPSARRAKRTIDVEEPEDVALLSPKARAKGPRVPMPARSQASAPPRPASPAAPAAPVVSVASRASSASVAPLISSVALAAPVTSVPAAPVTSLAAAPVTSLAAAPVTSLAAAPVTSLAAAPVTSVASPVTLAPVVSRVMAPAVTAAPVTLAPVAALPAQAAPRAGATYTYLPAHAPQATPGVAAIPMAAAPVATAASLFDALDVNGDGVLDASEFAQLQSMRAMPSEPVVRGAASPM